MFAVITITSAPPLYRHDLIQTMVEQVAVQLGRVVEREIAQRELADARDGAMEASRQKSEFLATMSHEIRTPLNGVIGLNDLLLRTRLDADQQRLASGVQGASRALLGLINDILDFSKIEAGKLELERVDFEVRAVLDQVANVLGEAARAKGLELLVSCDPSVPEVLAGDPTRLAQVVTNLGSNAVKFTASGEVQVRATADVGRRHGHPAGSRSPTPASGSTPASVRRSLRQLHPGRRVDHPRSTAAPASASPSRARSCTRSAARSASTAWPGRAASSGSPPSSTTRPAAREHRRRVRAGPGSRGRRVLVVDGTERQPAGDRRAARLVAGPLARRRLGATTPSCALEDAIVEGDPFDAVLIDRTLSLPRRERADPGPDPARPAGVRRRAAAADDSTTDLDFAAVRAGGHRRDA